MRENVFLIGFGNRARNGKDSAAEYIASEYVNSHIVHFADALKLEVRNLKRKDPLIYFDDGMYFILDKYDNYGEPVYVVLRPDTVPYLHEIFQKRNITEYIGMEGNGYDELKDGEMLQFWGTDFRRKMFSQNYWVDRTFEKVSEYLSTTDNEFDIIMLPDTRFYNEYNEIKFYNPNCLYVSVLRYNLDGSRYYDPSRDKDHPSEKELDDAEYDFLIEAKSGEMNKIYSKCDEIMNYIEKKIK